MKNLRESYVERKVTAWAKAQGLLPLKLTPDGEAGWPDHFYLFIYPAIAFIEFKRKGAKPRPLQEVRIAELKRRGYPVAVITDVESGIAFLVTSLLSGACGTAGHNAGVCGLSTAPRYGKDDDNLRHNQDTAGQAIDEEGSGDLPLKAHVPRVAKPEK